MPAEPPPTIRAATRTRSSGRTRPRQQGSTPDAYLRPYRSPIAPSHRTDAARPRELADGHQVERGLRGVEGGTDRRQGDVRDRQVEVGDGRDKDQRGQDHPPICGYRRATRPIAVGLDSWMSPRSSEVAMMIFRAPDGSIARDGHGPGGVAGAVEAGATEGELIGLLAAVSPVVGSPRTVAAMVVSPSHWVSTRVPVPGPSMTKGLTRRRDWEWMSSSRW